ncbi:APC family permease [Staphylococcus pseudoxylosus]|uniref:APC family permease n=1 Tax=Staphylococcus pseudoxylosus TaxID=2282419 RepID=UPI00298FBFA4|nr:APC family permease [Staphylococcus pseudoxylosus]MDW8797913.1 APC family permease [Staphylococcus pseudoxylosus]MEB6036802.1 APC family permease [Staphylococcus pseudoxylosus]MEB6043949.1 APC family permease [Staphylococcus pseudoxylosus]MEB7764711.1 APC family permease [Staphylococcus pseudoxylosus]MEB8009630.1 APC family permease [Staphylococcus pseudoxylosus]
MQQATNLKKVLGFTDVLGIAIGQIIGAGVMSLTGIGIQMTGSGITPAFILSAVITLLTMFPIAILGSTLPTTGGMYQYTSRLLSPKTGIFWLMLFMFLQITLSLYALSFAQYLEGLFPGVPVRTVAFLLLTILFIVNIVGIKSASIIGNLMVITLIIALSCFIIFGMPHVNFGVFNSSSMWPDGFTGFFTAVGLVSFATGGAQVVAELGGEMKNPKRDIPIVIIVATIFVGILYAFIASIAVGVLPIPEVAGRPLTSVAKEILPTPIFIFFMIGGAMFALATTLNSTFTWVTKSLLIAIHDGYLPKALGHVNKRFGTPHWLLLIFYIIGALPIVTGMSLNVVAQLGTGISLIVFAFPALAVTQLPKKYPEAYKQSPFKVPYPVLIVIAITAIVVLLYQSYLLISDLKIGYMIGTLIYILISAAIAQVSHTKANLNIDDIRINSTQLSEKAN